MKSEIVRYGIAMPNGGHRLSFEVGNCKVTFEPKSAEADDEACALASVLHGDAERWSALNREHQRVVEELRFAEAKIAKLEALVPPKQPQCLLRPGYVRFCSRGMWLLSRRETGWASWGVHVDGWDDLFRRYDVKVTAHGEDEHGQWWEVTP